jgi:hypothetical protein
MKFVVGCLSYYDGELHLREVTADSPTQAIAAVVRDIVGDDDPTFLAVEFVLTPDPDDWDELLEEIKQKCFNGDIVVNVMQLSE